MQSSATSLIFCIFNAVLDIGFIGSPFEANENDGFVTVKFGILTPSYLQAEVSIELFFSDSLAISKFIQEISFILW